MKLSLRKGFSFGLTSGIITTLGLIVGLEVGTGSKMVVLGGILTIAVADAMSDALGIHISEEAEAKHGPKEIWESTLATFLAKFVFALTFSVPIILFSPVLAVVVSITWGLSILSLISYYLAKQQKQKPFYVIGEHLLIAIVVIALTYGVGYFIAQIFN